MTVALAAAFSLLAVAFWLLAKFAQENKRLAGERDAIAAHNVALLTNLSCVAAERDESLARERELIASRYEMQLEIDEWRREAEVREEFRRVLGKAVAN